MNIRFIFALAILFFLLTTCIQASNVFESGGEITTNPNVTINKPLSLYNYTTTNRTLNVTYSDSNPDSCWYSLDSWLSNITFDYSIESYFTAGHDSNTLNIGCNDTFGALNSSESVNFYVFTPPAFISPPTPTSNWNSAGNNSFDIEINLNWSASECQFQWNYTVNTTMYLRSATNFTLTKVETTDGNYSYKVYCKSVSNNYWGASPERIAIISSASPDTTPPVLYNIQPSGNPEYSSGTYSVTFALNTNEISVCAYSLTNESFNESTNMSSTNSTTHTSAISVSSGQSYLYYIRCQDLSGNNNTNSETVRWRVVTQEEGGGGSQTTVICGNGICEPGETNITCFRDCGEFHFFSSPSSWIGSGNPGTELVCWGYEKGCAIKITNIENFTIPISIIVESNDQSYNFTTISLNGNGNESKKLDFEIIGNSVQFVYFYIRVPDSNQSLGQYQVNLKIIGGIKTLIFPIKMEIKPKEPISWQDLAFFLVSPVWEESDLKWWMVLFVILPVMWVLYGIYKNGKKNR